MILALSMSSAQALMALFDEGAHSFISIHSWNNLSGDELAGGLEKYYAQIVAALPKGEKITKVLGVEGPGSFTGLRVSSAFLKGVATALEIRLVGISSYDLFGEPFAFSLRPAKAATLTVEECIAREFKFLQVNANGVEVVARPTVKKIVGLKDTALWPSEEEFKRGIIASLEKSSFNLNYGYTPEFVTAK